MKKFTFLTAILSLLFALFSANNLLAQSLTANLTTIEKPTGANTVTVTLTRSGGWAGSGNYSLTVSSATGIQSPASFPFSTSSSTISIDFNSSAVVSTYTFTLTRSTTTRTATVTVTEPIIPDPIGCDGKFFVSYTPTSGVSATRLDSLGFSGAIINDYLFPTNNSITFNGIGISPLDGFLYGISDDGSLVKVGRNPGSVPPGFHSVVDKGAIVPSPSSTVYAACFDKNGDFYYSYGTNFRKILAADLNTSPTHTSTALPSLNGSGDNAPVSGTFLVDIAINPLDGKMYGISASTSGNATASYRLYEINMITGALTRLGAAGSGTTGQYPNSGNFIAALFFAEDGSLYGYRQDNQFLKMDLVNPQNSTNAGNGKAYSQADGCSCSFGRVFHDLDFTSNPGNQLCPSGPPGSPSQHIIFPMVVTVTNQSSIQQTGLTYTLDLGISDPASRFIFTQDAATIKSNLIAAGVATAGSTVTLTPVGGPYTKLVVSGFQTGASNSTVSFTLQLQLVNNAGTYVPIPLQSHITGLPAIIGGSDDSNDPTSPAPDDPTVITFCSNITLPVKLLSFSAVYKNSIASLNWEVENQVNFAFYDLQRSTDGVNFNSLAIIPAQNAGNVKQQYQHLDDLSSENGDVFYYRLRMVDIDRSSKYSNVLMIRKDEKNIQSLSVVPNPVSHDIATIRFTATETGTAEIRIINMAGKLVLSQKNNVFEGINSLSINNLNRLEVGTYLLQLVNDQTIMNSKFVISRY